MATTDINNTTVIKDPSAGNGLASSQDIDIGDVIIQIQSPYLLVVEKEALEKVCSFCLIEASSVDTPLKRCSACKIPRYCSFACQKKDWTAEHQRECPMLKKLPDLPPTPVRGLMQIMLRHRYGRFLDPRWGDLESHSEDLIKDQRRWDEVVLQARAAIEFSKSPQDQMDVAIQVLCRMITNAFRATLADDSPVGLCFEPILALANHSCSPNAVVVFDGRTVALRALAPMTKGDQIFISYIDATTDRSSRQTVLKQRYFFECACEKCRNDESPYTTFLRNAPSTEGRMDLLCNSNSLTANPKNPLATLDIKNVDESSPHFDKAKKCLELIQSPGIDQIEKGGLLKEGAREFLSDPKLLALHPFPKILHELFLNSIDAGSFVHSLVILLFLLLNCDVYNYPQPHHPVRVIRLFTIAKLLKHISSLTPVELQMLIGGGNELRRAVAGIDWIDSCHAILVLVWEQGCKSHGKESRFMKEVKMEIKDVEEVQRLRGIVGGHLRNWMGDASSVEGRKEARRIFMGLRKLSECTEEIVVG